MSKEDKYGLAGVLLCSGLAWFDAWWRPFWIVCAVLLAVWTVGSLLNRQRR